MNRGIAASRAPYVCLLNNDLRFTKGWLEELLAVAQADPRIGVLNPTSSTFGARPPRGVSLQQYADALRVHHRGVYREVGMGIGFCLLIKREVLDRIGGLSEEVERIFFEDEDFSMRAQRAGFQCVVAAASYVYHAEHHTVRKMPEREALFARNQRWCHAKWGRWVRIAWPRFRPVSPGTAELRQWLERLQRWARRRVHVYVYSPLPNGMTADALFRSVGLVPHVDILWHAVSTYSAPLVAAGLILKRQKKPFDLIAAPQGRWAEVMRRLRWVHHAEVVAQDDEAGLLAHWQQRAYPSRVGA